jgi:hypothetical protein
MTVQEVLQDCKVEGNTVKLPPVQLDRKLYQDVAKALNLIGGSWKGGKVQAFVFQQDPTELLQQIAGGESRNLKKEFQFFATPNSIADYLVELADIEEGDSILEPSAGQGAIVKAIQRVLPEAAVDCFELMPLNQTFLSKISNVLIKGQDFLQYEGPHSYDKIIGNPPFSKNQDCSHIRKMYELCRPTGRIVSVASKHWQTSGNRVETEFRNWLDQVNAEVYEIEAGAFKESGTMISSCIIVINK